MAAVLAVAALSSTGHLPALAYNLAGWSWDHVSLTYEYIHNTSENLDFPTWDEPYFTQGANGWNSAPTPITFTQVTSGADIQVMARTTTPCNGCGAVTSCITYKPNSSTLCQRALVQVYFGATGTTQSAPDYDEYIGGHELGHALGLAHSCVDGSLMAGPGSAPCSGHGYSTNWPQTPQQDDVDGANHLYPGYGGTGGGGAGGCAPPYVVVPVVGHIVDDPSGVVFGAESRAAYVAGQSLSKVPGLARIPAPSIPGGVLPGAYRC